MKQMLALLLVVCTPTYSADCFVRNNAVVVSPLVQQIIPVPVQPYYYSYSGQVSSGNTQQIKKVTESEYLTKKEFLEAMRMVLAESKGDTAYIKENNPEENKLKELVRNRCVQCHTSSPVTWKNSNVPVTFFQPDGRWSPDINWDRMVTVTVGGSMPKGGPRLNGDEVTLFIKKAEKHEVPLPPPPAAQVQPPSDTNY